MNGIVVGVLVVELALVGALFVSLRDGRTAAAVNIAVAIVATLVPSVVDALLVEGRTPLVPELTLWVAVAGFLHVLGMLGLYESTWWWDHVTHLVSSALVATLLYAGTLGWTAAAGTGAGTAYAGAVALGGTVVLGVVWELGELLAREVGRRYDIEPVLVHYGWRDTALDLVFDVVGALVVVGADVRVFVPLVRSVSNAAGTPLFVDAASLTLRCAVRVGC